MQRRFEGSEVLEIVESFSKRSNLRDIFPLTQYKIIAKFNRVYLFNHWNVAVTDQNGGDIIKSTICPNIVEE